MDKGSQPSFHIFIKPIIAHTVALTLTLLSIFLVQSVMVAIWGREFRIFDSFRLSVIIGVAYVFALGLYLWRIVRSPYEATPTHSKQVAKLSFDEKVLSEEPKVSISGPLQETIVEFLGASKLKRIRTASFIVLLTGVVYVTLSLRLSYDLSIGFLAIIGLLLLALVVNQWALTHRIGQGIYGNNEYEAREIITYILSNSDKEDFSDGGDSRRLMLPLKKEVPAEPALGEGLGEVQK